MALIALREETDAGYIRSLQIRQIDTFAVNRAREVFGDYKERGVIIRGDFDDSSWMFNNEERNVGVTVLAFDEFGRGAATKWLGCTAKQYALAVKVYITLNLGLKDLSTLQELSRTFNKLSSAQPDDVIGMVEYAPHITAFMELLSGGNEQRDAVIEKLEERTELRKKQHRKGQQRKLADFKAYLRFNEVLSGFWQTADKRQKLFYFPLYFWWNLTAVLPLRVAEFLLTPRDCLKSVNGEDVLTVRRTKLKGGKEQIGYRIDADYELCEYTITPRLADELRWYVNATEKMAPTEINTLLRQQPHFNYIGREGHIANRYYTYQTLVTCLRYFGKEMAERHGVDVDAIHFGDTRHLAMISLILSGGSPTICRELAGHADIDISAHYFSNISNLVECVTLERFRKIKGTAALIEGKSVYPANLAVASADKLRVTDGWCGSAAMKVGEIEDCLKVKGGDGLTGNCKYCVHYYPDDFGVRLTFMDTKAAKEQVDADSKYLLQMIEIVRRGLGYTEDIGAALLRLQHSGDRYGKFLWEKFEREGCNNGTT